MFKKTLLVTGASGFIGLHLVPALLRYGYCVRAVTRSKKMLVGSEVYVIRDLCDVNWSGLLKGVDAVIHLAGIAHTRGVDPLLLKRINTDIMGSLVRSLGVSQKLIYFSSIRAQTGAWCPQEVLDDAPPQPEDDYGRSKLAGEHLVSAIRGDACIFRPVTVYGPGCKMNLKSLYDLARMRLPLPLASLTQKRSYVSIENIISAVEFALSEDLSGPFILSDPDPLSVAEIVWLLRMGLGRDPWLVPAPEAILASLSSLLGKGAAFHMASRPLVAPPKKMLRAGWSPAVSSAQGIINWAKHNNEIIET